LNEVGTGEQITRAYASRDRSQKSKPPTQ